MYHRFLQNRYLQVILLCFLTSSAMIIPFIISGHGLFTLIDDFNYQQIPFNIQSNYAIKHGDIFWNWYTDLGSNFIGAYSFYTLGSPFFWLSLLFPPNFFPYLIGPMLILKYCVAGVTSYAYVQQYIRNKNYAVIGSLLYAFSGFSTVNLMFNHFHDVIALFPLLLLSLDKMMKDKKVGLFALIVALNAFLNFFFFIGEIIFLIIYFCIRFLYQDFKVYVKKLPYVILEGTLGLGIASVIFIPSILFTLQNPRTDTFLYGSSSLFYNGDRYLMILKALLLPADIMSYESTISAVDFTSNAAYIPVFGISLIVALLFSKKNWMTQLIKVLLIIALVPVLNSIFYVFNAAYYARWFYMPVLIMSLISAYVLDHSQEIKIRKGIRITFFLTILYIGYLLFYPTSSTKFGFALHYKLFAIYCFFSIAGLFLTWILAVKISAKRRLPLLICSIVVSSSLLGSVNIYKMQKIRPNQDSLKLYNIIVKMGTNLKMPQGEFYRVNIEALNKNYSMVSNIPSVNSFTSTINGSIFKFYNSLGLPRVVFSTLPDNYYALSTLLSDKYQITPFKHDKNKVYTSYNTGSDKVYVYENHSFLPMGFAYDYFLTESQFAEIPALDRHLFLLKSIVIPNESTKVVKKWLSPLPYKQLKNTSYTSFKNDVKKRSSESSNYFHYNTNGFVSKIHVATKKMVFFSVPFDQGWKAKVNNQDVPIIESDGFMSVPVQPGSNKIEFNYMTPGLKSGIIISIISLIIFFLYHFLRRNDILKKTILK